MHNVKILLLFFVIFFSQNLFSKDYLLQKFDSLYKNVSLIKMDDVKLAESMVKQLYGISKFYNNPQKLEVKAIYQDVMVKLAAGLPIENIADIIKLKLNSGELKSDSFEKGLLFKSIAELSILLGDYAYALECALEAINIFNKLNQFQYLALTNNTIGNIFTELKDGNNALKYYNKALNYFIEIGDRKRELTIKTNISTYYFFIGKVEQAIELIKEVINGFNESYGYSILVIAYADLGNYYSAVESKIKSNLRHDCYMRASNALKYVKNENLTVLVKHTLASYYLEIDNLDSAYLYFKELQQFYKKNNKLVSLLSAYSGLSTYFKEKKQFDSVCFYLSAYINLKTKLTGEDKIADIHNVKVKYILSEYENKLIIADKEVQLKERMNIIIVLILIGMFLIVVLVLSYVLYQKKIMKHREKINFQNEHIMEIEIHELNEKILNEEKISKLQKERFKAEIDAKNREICSSLLLVSSKNEILKDINKQINEIDKGDISTRELKGKLDSMIKTSLKLDDEWNFFKMHFEKVHPDFFYKLKEKYKTLTENELRLCAYIRIGMRTKQIARMLSLNPESVKKNKYRLKMKFNEFNDNDISLEDFIRNL